MKATARSPIGVFDSGIGGLTIARAIIEALPVEDIIYVGDTAHLPYGDKSAALIKYYSIKITEFLISKGCKLIVIACNTASSVAYEELVEIFGDRVTFVNVVDPTVKALAADDSLKHVGIIGTKGTIASGIYEHKLKALKPKLKARSLATPLLAPMIEAGFFHNNISRSIIESYLTEENLGKIDALILACTHYPLIRKDIEAHYLGKVRVEDSTLHVANEVKKILEQRLMLNNQPNGSSHFYATDITESFSKTTQVFFGEQVQLEFCPLWDSL